VQIRPHLSRSTITPQPSNAVPQLSKSAKKQQRITKVCCVKGCKSNNINHSSFVRIQSAPILPPEGSSKRRFDTYEIKAKRRSEQLTRCGLSRKDKRKDLRYCTLHETKGSSSSGDGSLKCKTTKSKSQYTLNNLPSTNCFGKNSHYSQPSKPSKGNSFDRYASKCMDTITQNNPEAASWIQATQKAYEEQTPSKHTLKINPTVKEKFGIDDTPKNNSSNKSQKQRYIRDSQPKNHKSWLEKPKYQPFASMYYEKKNKWSEKVSQTKKRS
jgi:hypothetical protein